MAGVVTGRVVLRRRRFTVLLWLNEKASSRERLDRTSWRIAEDKL